MIGEPVFWWMPYFGWSLVGIMWASFLLSMSIIFRDWWRSR